MERYKKIEKSNPDATLGEGAYGVVYKAIDLNTNKHVALKKIRVEIEDEGIPTTALREIVLLRQLEHPNVVKLENVVMDPARLYLVFELVDTDLKKYMDSNKAPLSPDLVQSYTTQILEGLAYCHSMGVMHRDLKPQNILVTRDGGLKIADFGLARAFTPQHRPLTVEVITRWYRAPEILLGCNVYSSSVDLWSVGCILAEMSNKKAFLPGDSEIDQLHKIFMELGTPTPLTWPGLENQPHWRNTFPNWVAKSWSSMVPSLGPEGGDFLSKLFVYIPENRYSAEEALSHPFVTRAYRNNQNNSFQSPTREFAQPSVLPISVQMPEALHRSEKETVVLGGVSTGLGMGGENTDFIHRVTPDDIGTTYDDFAADSATADDQTNRVGGERPVKKSGNKINLKDGNCDKTVDIQGDILAVEISTVTVSTVNAVTVNINILKNEEKDKNENINENEIKIKSAVTISTNNNEIDTTTTTLPIVAIGKTRESKRKLSLVSAPTLNEPVAVAKKNNIRNTKNSEEKENGINVEGETIIVKEVEKEVEKMSHSKARMRFTPENSDNYESENLKKKEFSSSKKKIRNDNYSDVNELDNNDDHSFKTTLNFDKNEIKNKKHRTGGALARIPVDPAGQEMTYCSQDSCGVYSVEDSSTTHERFSQEDESEEVLPLRKTEKTFDPFFEPTVVTAKRQRK